MENWFGRDLSRVRVHADATAAASAQAVHSRAYTVGQDVAFGRGEYAPATERGRELLAHELAHTVQQDPVAGRLGRPGTAGELEASADAAARAATAGRRVSVTMPTSGIGLACKPVGDEGPESENELPSKFMPGGFTDKEIDALVQEGESRIKLGSLALTLAERQARRREFWNGNPSYNSADLKTAFALDLYWDPKEDGYIRQPYVDKWEAMVLADPEARSLYNGRLWDLTENKPEQKSRFTRAVHFVCEHTEPCSSNIQQFRKDRESGMTRAEALNRGMARLVVTAETMALPTPGPRGPIAIGPRPGPTPTPVTGPAPEAVGVGGAKSPVPVVPEPVLTTGSSSGGSRGKVGATGEGAVPEPVVDAPTNPIPRTGPGVGEKVGEFRIYGEKRLKGNTFERDIYGIKSIEKPTTEVGVRPLLNLIKSLLAEAKAAGATHLKINGNVVVNKNILKMGPLVEKLGGTFKKVNDTTVSMEIPVSQ